MRRTGKEIFCRFRISNQIFGSNYGSRDIQRSLDTTFAVFGENLNFMDDYLENKIFAGYAVFAGCSHTICTIIFDKKKLGSTRQISGKSRKSAQKSTFSNFLDDPKIFWIIRSVQTYLLMTLYHRAKFQENLYSGSIITFCDRA